MEVKTDCQGHSCDDQTSYDDINHVLNHVGNTKCSDNHRNNHPYHRILKRKQVLKWNDNHVYPSISNHNSCVA